MAAVLMPDGQTVEMPDQLDPQLGARLRAFHDSQVAKPPSTGDKILSRSADVLKNDPANPAGMAAGGIENVISGVTGGIGSLMDALTGAAPGTHNFAYVPRTAQGKVIQAGLGTVGGAATDVAAKGLANTGLDAQDIGGSAQQALEETLKERIPEALGAVGTIAGVGGAAESGLGALGARSAAAEAAAPAAVTKYGMRTLADHPIATGAAGASGPQAVILHNQPLGNTVLGAEAGVPHGTPLVAGEKGSLAQGRAAPGSVYDRLEASLPTAPLSPQAERMMRGAGTTKNVLTQPSEATQATIEAQKARLLQQPLTGPQVVQTSRALRQEGGTRLGSDDVEQQNLGSAQLAIARALEQHVADTLPANAPVSLDQFQAARTALAKNYAVQGALKGGNVDMQAIARMQLRDPDLLTGPTKDIADFANQHPAVTRLANNIEVRPSYAGDLGAATGGKIESLLSPAFYSDVLGGRSLARRLLTGDPEAAMFAARRTPVSGLAGEFDPIDRTPQPPPGLTASPPTAPAPPAAGPPGQIPLADVLSHGVEQPPAAGLQSAPMGAPPQTGIPFQRNAAHEAGGLTLDELLGGPRTYGGQSASDLPGVMSAQVPDGTVTRTAAPGGVSKIAHSPAFINENASLGNPASLEGVAAKNQDLAKGVQPVSFGADDTEHPMSPHDIERRDLNPAPDSIFINKKDGSIINSGGMAPRLAQGLLARWKALHGPLGSAYE